MLFFPMVYSLSYFKDMKKSILISFVIYMNELIKEESEIDEEEEHEESEEIPEERVPTPHNIKRDEEELDTDQVDILFRRMGNR